MYLCVDLSVDLCWQDFPDQRTKDIRVVVELKNNAHPQTVLNYLYKHTQLEETFHYNCVALVDGIPQTLSLRGFLESFVLHRKEVVTRRTKYDLFRAEERERRVDRAGEVLAGGTALRDPELEAVHAGAGQHLGLDEVKQLGGHLQAVDGGAFGHDGAFNSPFRDRGLRSRRRRRRLSPARRQLPLLHPSLRQQHGSLEQLANLGLRSAG